MEKLSIDYKLDVQSQRKRLLDSNTKILSIALGSLTWNKPLTACNNVELMPLLKTKGPSTIKEIISWFRSEGLSITAIAGILCVERKTVYTWLSGGLLRGII